MGVMHAKRPNHDVIVRYIFRTGGIAIAVCSNKNTLEIS